jgi:hypothetical protein
MGEKQGPGRWQAAAAARRVAAAYRANREDLEPLLRLVADVLALAALVRGRRGNLAEAGEAEGAAP